MVGRRIGLFYLIDVAVALNFRPKLKPPAKDMNRLPGREGFLNRKGGNDETIDKHKEFLMLTQGYDACAGRT